MRKQINNLLKIGLPLLLATAILVWMYRGIQWEEIRRALADDMSWTWMLLSFPFGVSAQLFRAFRWRQTLEPLGERPRLRSCANAIFLSYASSLVVPRIGEVLRCGVLSRYEGVGFSRALGTVVTERAVDMLMVLTLCVVTFLTQIPVFTTFFQETGVSMDGFLKSFSFAGYLVSAVCALCLLGVVWWMVHRFRVLTQIKSMAVHIREGLFSVLSVRRPWLFLFHSVGIWLSYYLHFYLTFYCFSYTEDLGAVAALVAFVVGCIAVVVPTPNGAGPWHFAVKTILVLYAVPQVQAAVFVLVVHSIQTLLIVILGLYALVSLGTTKPRQV